jgi:hypothetical protein
MRWLISFKLSFLIAWINSYHDDDDPWVTQEIKDLDRKKKREFFKHHKSEKWQDLNERFEQKCETAKEHYYENIVKDL